MHSIFRFIFKAVITLKRKYTRYVSYVYVPVLLLYILYADNVKTGARVVRGPGWDNNTDFDGGHGYVGTVTNVSFI